MATYGRLDNSIPSSERVAIISAVAAGDRIDLTDVLGRPARSLTFNMTASTDEVTYRINHLKKIRTSRPAEEALSDLDYVHGVYGTTVVEVWNTNASVFTGTGSEYLEINSNLRISSIEIVSLTLGTGSTITIEVT